VGLDLPCRDSIIAAVILDRLLHHSTTVNIRGESYRLKERRKAGLIPLPESQQDHAPGWRPERTWPTEAIIMSFFMHKQICQSDVIFKPRTDADSGFARGFVVLTSLLPAIPWRVGLHQSSPPLHQPVSILQPTG